MLRPNETIIPRAGRLSAFIAILCLILALSLVAQGLMGEMLDDVGTDTRRCDLQTITAGLGAVYGLVIALAVVIGGISLHARAAARAQLAAYICCTGW